jgi:hypothetical protein
LKNNAMKKLVPVLLLIILSFGAERAFSQKGDFSDWNVPPPLAPGTIPKGPVTVKPAVLQLPADLQAPGFPSITDIKLAALTPILLTAPDVPAPAQPEFPALPFQTPDIPLPQVPVALDLPKQAPRDEVIEDVTDMPSPAIPEMPNLPNLPDVQPDNSTGEKLKLPIVPALIKQPATGALPEYAFPFTDWPVPAIPLNVHFNFAIPVKPAGNKLKPHTNRKSVKKRQGDN